MPNHARHRRPSGHNNASRAALTIAVTGATAALPLLGGVGGTARAATAPRADPPTGGHGGDPARAAAGQPVTHVVRSGEDLSRIATTFHVPGGWEALYQDNRQTIGPDPNLIRPGERLRIPVKRAAGTATGSRARTHSGAPAPAPVAKPAAPAKPAPAPSPPPAAPTAPAPVTSSAPAPGAAPEGMPGTWTSVFDDEFNGDSLDTANWATGWHGSGVTPPVTSDEQECYDPAQVSVGGGYLHLDAAARSEQCGGRTEPYTSGMVNTEGLHAFAEGAFEARIYLPESPDGGIADWPAFWTDGQSWPADGEMDVMEGLSGMTCYHFHGPDGAPGSCRNTGPGWHTFGAEWENGTVTYYYDGRDVGSTSTDGVNAPQYLVLDNAVDVIGGQPGAADMLVDYVRVWKKAG